MQQSNPKTQSPLWRKAIFVWMIATVVGWLISGRLAPNEFELASLNIMKSWMYLGLFVSLSCIPAISGYWKNAHPSETFFISAAVLFLMIGQTAGQSRKTFPFVEWNMYNKAAAKDDVLIIEYVGVRANGERQVLAPGQVFPALGRGTLRLQNLLDLLVKGGMTRAEGEAKDEFLRRLDQTLLAMKEEYNHRFPDQSLIDIEVHLSYVDLPLRSKTLVKSTSYSPSERMLVY